MQLDDASEEFGLEASKRENVREYEVVLYTNESFENAPVYVEIKKDGYVIGTIKDLKTLNGEEKESYRISLYNYEGSLIYKIDSEYMGNEEFSYTCRYDTYGNLIYCDDGVDCYEAKYDFAEEDYQYIICQMEEILCYNKEYRQNWN